MNRRSLLKWLSASPLAFLLPKRAKLSAAEIQAFVDEILPHFAIAYTFCVITDGTILELQMFSGDELTAHVNHKPAMVWKTRRGPHRVFYRDDAMVFEGEVSYYPEEKLINLDFFNAYQIL